MTDWTTLRHAYGAADDVPALLAAAEADDDAAWSDLWGYLCHQGTVYSASYPALPALADLAQRPPARSINNAVQLAASIMASTPGEAAQPYPAVAATYPDALKALRGCAEAELTRVDGATDFVFALASLAALEGLVPWGGWLDVLVTEEADLECPGCDEQLVVAIADTTATTSLLDDDVPAVAVRPAEPAERDEAQDRLVELAARHDRPEVVARMAFLFGTLTCPGCEQQFRLADALTVE